MRIRTLLSRAFRLRCPHCGRGELFAGWFRMFEKCEFCGLPIEPQPGYYLGSVYVNYGLTSLLVSVTFMSLFLGFDVSPDVLLWPLFAFCLLFPLAFFRYARSLWRSMDEFFDPYEGKSEDKADR